MSLHTVPMSTDEARDFVAEHHRHCEPARCITLEVGVADETGRLVGVATAGRPLARGLCDGRTLEIRRVCVLPDAPIGANSFLYGALRRAARALGWRRLVTYTLQSESGASLRGAGWQCVADLPARSWNAPARKRRWQPVYGEPKRRWEVAA